MTAFAFLAASAAFIYFIVFGLHFLRGRVSQAPFFAVIGALSAITVWITDSGVRVSFLEMTFLYGSVVFFMAVLLGVFLAYAFDGALAGQMAIASAVGVTVLTPLMAAATHFQMNLPGVTHWSPVPLPSVRIYVFSATAMLIDFILIAVIWQAFTNYASRLPLFIRVFVVILAALWADALVFTTGAFFEDPAYWEILQANVLSRFLVALAVAPIMAGYMAWEMRRQGVTFARRPLFSILGASHFIEKELSAAQSEVERRRAAEKALENQLRFLKSLLEAIPYPVFYKDRDGRYLGGNRAFEEMTGLSLEQSTGRLATELFPPKYAERFREEDESILSQPGIQRFETRSPNNQGEERDVILSKGTFHDVDGNIAGIVGVMVDITERKELERKLTELATRDELTGLMNRRHFFDHLDREVARARKGNTALAVLMFDVDKFKEVNDTHGHAAGDRVLVRVAEVCREQLTPGTYAGRIGGDEFALLFPGFKEPMALQVAEQLRAAIERQHTVVRNADIHCTVSIGVAMLDTEDAGQEELLQRGDVLMYEAKHKGGNRVAGPRPGER